MLLSPFDSIDERMSRKRLLMLSHSNIRTSGRARSLFDRSVRAENTWFCSSWRNAIWRSLSWIFSLRPERSLTKNVFTHSDWDVSISHCVASSPRKRYALVRSSQTFLAITDAGCAPSSQTARNTSCCSEVIHNTERKSPICWCEDMCCAKMCTVIIVYLKRKIKVLFYSF